MYKSTLLKAVEQKEVIIKITKDYILWRRIEESLFTIHNIYAPVKKESIEWEADTKYSGIDIIMLLLEVDYNNDKLRELLFNMFHSNIDIEETNANDNAILIYQKLLLILDEYCTQKQVA